MAWGQAIGGFIQGAAGTIMDAMNLGFQIENRDWQRKMLQESWSREDTAVQRRRRDLEAAGINPVLAAGQAAQASGPIGKEAPQGRMENIMKSAQIAQAKAGIEHTRAQNEVLREEARLKRLDAILRTKADRRAEESLQLDRDRFGLSGRIHDDTLSLNKSNYELQRMYQERENQRYALDYFTRLNEDDRREAAHRLENEAKRLGIDIKKEEFVEWMRNIQHDRLIGTRSDINSPFSNVYRFITGHAASLVDMLFGDGSFSRGTYIRNGLRRSQ